MISNKYSRGTVASWHYTDLQLSQSGCSGPDIAPIMIVKWICRIVCCNQSKFTAINPACVRVEQRPKMEIRVHIIQRSRLCVQCSLYQNTFQKISFTCRNRDDAPCIRWKCGCSKRGGRQKRSSRSDLWVSKPNQIGPYGNCSNACACCANDTANDKIQAVADI